MQPTNQPTNRQAYLDWLRILAILGVLFFHSAMPFVAEWGWHIKNKETSHLLLKFNFWLHNFRCRCFSLSRAPSAISCCRQKIVRHRVLPFPGRQGYGRYKKS